MGHRDQLGGTRRRWDGGKIQEVSGNWGWREMGRYVRFLGAEQASVVRDWIVVLRSQDCPLPQVLTWPWILQPLWVLLSCLPPPLLPQAPSLAVRLFPRYHPKLVLCHPPKSLGFLIIGLLTRKHSGTHPISHSSSSPALHPFSWTGFPAQHCSSFQPVLIAPAHRGRPCAPRYSLSWY